MSGKIYNTTSHKKSFGFVYKWTYNPTGEYYIGIHKGHPNDGYIGSGARFIKKYNNTKSDDWSREILFEGDYWNRCKKIEKDLVNQHTLNDPLCLNLAPGGGAGYYGSHHDKKKQSYRTNPQEVTINGITYPTRMFAIKHLNISFEELNTILIENGWNESCRYNTYNKY